MNIYEQLNKIDDNESLCLNLKTKNIRKFSTLKEFVISNASEAGFKKEYSAYVEDKLNHAVLNENMSKKFTKRLHESRK